jgi:acyl carrier protein
MPVTKTLSTEELKQIIFKVLGQIAPEADFAKLQPDESIQRALDIDSFDFLNLLIGLNEELGVEIPEADYAQVSTLRGLIDYLGAQIAPRREAIA